MFNEEKENYYQTRRQELQNRYAAKLNKLGQAALDYSGDVAELQKQLDELNQREATAKAEAEKPAEKKPEKK